LCRTSRTPVSGKSKISIDASKPSKPQWATNSKSITARQWVKFDQCRHGGPAASKMRGSAVNDSFTICGHTGTFSDAASANRFIGSRKSHLRPSFKARYIICGEE